MIRGWHRLGLLVAAIAFVVAVRAEGPADPAAALLPLPRAKPTDIEQADGLPRSSTDRPTIVRIQLGSDFGKSVRSSEYEESKRTAEKQDGDGQDKPDTWSYLAGRSEKDASERDSYERRTRSWDEDVPAPPSTILTKDDPNFFERMGRGVSDLFDRGAKAFNDEDKKLFASDRRFDCFISPLTNPFYSEDPRSVTEVRPIMIYQTTPGGQQDALGGNAFFIGGQARLALTERWSVVVNKLGYQSFRSGSASPFSFGGGLSEFWIGPKYLIYRDAATQTLFTGGATFQIPVGPDKNFQNTGKLSIVPYVTSAKKLLPTDLGTLNGMASTGYSFGTTKARSDFFFLSAHLDFDIGNNHRFYPVAELNWFSVTKGGDARDLSFEGRDLANVGAPVAGRNLVTWALGGRYKVPTGRWEFGAAFEMPLIGQRDLLQSRFTFDLIWRY